MNVLDSMIAFFAPEWGARRAAWRRYGDEIRMNSVVLAVYLLFSVAYFFTVHEHWPLGCHFRNLPEG